jgi:hypothetical protein
MAKKTTSFTFNPRAGTMDQPGPNPPSLKKQKYGMTRPKARPAAPKKSVRPKKRPGK